MSSEKTKKEKFPLKRKGSKIVCKNRQWSLFKCKTLLLYNINKKDFIVLEIVISVPKYLPIFGGGGIFKTAIWLSKWKLNEKQ